MTYSSQARQQKCLSRFLERVTLQYPEQRRPESQGLVAAGVYILLLIIFIPFLFADSLRREISPAIDEETTPMLELTRRPFPHQQACGV